MNWIANPNYNHSHLLDILEIIQIYYSSSNWRLLWSLSGHICPSPPPIMLTIIPRMVGILWACGPISFEHMSFWMIVFGYTTDHIPLRNKCPNYCQVWFRHVYFESHVNDRMSVGTLPLKIDMPNSIVDWNHTHVFEWYVVWCGSKNKYLKYTCLSEIGLGAQNSIYVLGSVVNIIGWEGGRGHAWPLIKH